MFRWFPAFVNVFVIWALLLAGGNLLAEASSSLTLTRVVWTIWMMILFACPALTIAMLYDLRTAPRGVYNYWRLIWTFSFFSYAIHTALAVFDFFGGSIDDVYAKQGPVVATTNFVLLGTWLLEILSIWLGCRTMTGFYIYQWLVHLLAIVATFVAAVVFKTGIVWWLGLFATAIPVAMLFFRIILGSASPMGSEEGRG